MDSAYGQIAVVGAGVIGTLCAIRLRDAGHAVTLFDDAAGGAAQKGEASARAAGMLATISEQRAPSRFVDALVAGRDAYTALADEIAAHGIDIGYRRAGTLEVARDEQQAQALVERAAFHASIGWSSELLAAADVTRCEPALNDVTGALYYPDEHQVDPAALLRGLHTMWRAGGGKIVHEHVQRVTIRNARVTGVQIDHGTVAFDAIVIAGGSWSAQLCDSEALFGCRVLSRWLRPSRGQLLEFCAPPALLSRVIHCDKGYLVPRFDGRVVVGSTLEDVGFDANTTIVARQALTAWATELCPALSQATLARHWSGLRPRSLDDRPLVGKTATEGLFIATGHFRNGIVLAPHTARQIVAIMNGNITPEDRLFSPLRFAEGKTAVAEINDARS